MGIPIDRPPVATRLLVPFAIGMLVGGLYRPGMHWVIAVVVFTTAGARLVRAPGSRTVLAAAAAGTALGALAGAVAHLPPPSEHVVRFAGPGISAIEGVVVRSERLASGVALVVRVEHVRNRRRAGHASGLLGVTVAHTGATWPVGSQLRVVGRMRRPRNFGNPGSYDQEAALVRRGILVTMFLWDDEQVASIVGVPSDFWHRVGTVRSGLAAWIARRSDEPVRGYLTAVLLGATQSLDHETRKALTRTGLSHVVSVSGFHIAVVAGACFLVLRWLALRMGGLALRIDVGKLAAATGLLPVGAYAMIAGDSVPATRAFLTYGVVLGALACDRPPDSVRALATAAVLLAFSAPDIAADVSFELSFLSVLALILMTRRHGMEPHDRRPFVSWRRVLVESLQTSLVATVATAPLTAWHFQQISLVAPLANLLTLPLLGPATLLPGLLALPLIEPFPWLAEALFLVASWAAGLGLAIAVWLATLPWAAIDTPMPSLLEVALCYAALALWWLSSAATGVSGRVRSVAIAMVVAVSMADVGYWIWERCGNGTLRVTFLSVGQGDAAIVELPGGGVLAIDGGGFPGEFDPGERLIAPYLRSRKILRLDVLALSHPQLDHYGGLAYLAEHFLPREFWSNGARASSAGFRRLEAALAASDTRSIVLTRGNCRRFGSEVLMEVLHPDRVDGVTLNDASLVLRLSFGTTSILFTGDIERGAELALLAGGATLTSDVLKVPHHGSATSSTRAWLAAVAPTIAVISSGSGNRFGFPAPEVVHRLRDVGATVWNTAESGAVRVVSDGRHVRAEPTLPPRGPAWFEFPRSLW